MATNKHLGGRGSREGKQAPGGGPHLLRDRGATMKSLWVCFAVWGAVLVLSSLIYIAWVRVLLACMILNSFFYIVVAGYEYGHTSAFDEMKRKERK